MYLECLRDQFLEVQECVHLDAGEMAHAEGADYESDEEVEDADYDSDIPDLGRDALVDLLNATMTLED